MFSAHQEKPSSLRDIAVFHPKLKAITGEGATVHLELSLLTVATYSSRITKDMHHTLCTCVWI